MEIYTESYLRNHCVDVFFRSNGRAIHIVTDGCLLPVDLTDVLTNRRLQHQISMKFDNFEEIRIGHGYDVEINQAYVNLIQSRAEALGEEYMNYHLDPYFLLSHHALMSQIGFYSYACIWDDVEETQCRFILVSSPKGHQCHVPDNLILPYLEESNIHWDIENEEFVFDL